MMRTRPLWMSSVLIAVMAVQSFGFVGSAEANWVGRTDSAINDNWNRTKNEMKGLLYDSISVNHFSVHRNSINKKVNADLWLGVCASNTSHCRRLMYGLYYDRSGVFNWYPKDINVKIEKNNRTVPVNVSQRNSLDAVGATSYFSYGYDDGPTGTYDIIVSVVFYSYWYGRELEVTKKISPTEFNGEFCKISETYDGYNTGRLIWNYGWAWSNDGDNDFSSSCGGFPYLYFD